jgi:hypothetical protein
MYWFWRHNGTSNDQPPTPENSDRDDNRAKIRVQEERVQHSLRPNNKHHSIFHATQLLPSFAWQSWNCDKQRREEDGSGSAYVAIGDVHRGANGHLGEQGCSGANVGGTPVMITHREVAGSKVILGLDGKTIAIQGGSATCTRDSSSQRGRQNTGNAVLNAETPACKADCANGGGKQIKHGRHDGVNECSCVSRRSPIGPSAGQGEHPSGKKYHPLWQWRPSQETQAEESPLSQLQMFCNAQASWLLRA